jgi:hypothetical protein
MLHVQLHFADDAQEQPVEIFHRLKLYGDGEPTQQSTKKPVRELLAALACSLELSGMAVHAHDRQRCMHAGHILFSGMLTSYAVIMPFLLLAQWRDREHCVKAVL